MEENYIVEPLERKKETKRNIKEFTQKRTNILLKGLISHSQFTALVPTLLFLPVSLDPHSPVPSELA